PYGVYWPTTVAGSLVTQTVHLDHDGETREVARVPGGTAVGEPWTPQPAELADAAVAYPAHAPLPLGRVFGARSGDKGGDANIGVWARTAPAYAWLRDFLTVERVHELLPETRAHAVDVHLLPNLLAVNVVVHGLLGRGVAANTAVDPQGKGLGEYLRAKTVDLPAALLAEGTS
ncbi:MAG: exopolyphosphatase, partial [Actinomycetes bacterium]